MPNTPHVQDDAWYVRLAWLVLTCVGVAYWDRRWGAALAVGSGALFVASLVRGWLMIYAEIVAHELVLAALQRQTLRDYQLTQATDSLMRQLDDLEEEA